LSLAIHVVKPAQGPSYEVRVGRDALDLIPDLIPRGTSRVVLLADETVDRLYGDRAAGLFERAAPCLRVTFPAGEESKSRSWKERIENRMLDEGAGRDSLVAALGGGVAMDLAGFTAATFMRGVKTLLFPTSLVAMVDAAIGGKTGVNTDAGKNLVGAFHHPIAVLADVECLLTLPAAERRNGLAEMAKAGAVADESLFNDLVQDGPDPEKDLARTADLVSRSVAVKTAVVSADPEDRGLRQILNFGHTVGHALERATAYGLSHGDAVAIGMAVEARMAREAGILPEEEQLILAEGLRAIGLPVAPVRNLTVSVSNLVSLMETDKKRRKGSARFSLPEAIGRMAAGPDGSYTVPLDPPLVERILRKVFA